MDSSLLRSPEELGALCAEDEWVCAGPRPPRPVLAEDGDTGRRVPPCAVCIILSLAVHFALMAVPGPGSSTAPAPIMEISLGMSGSFGTGGGPDGNGGKRGDALSGGDESPAPAPIGPVAVAEPEPPAPEPAAREAVEPHRSEPEPEPHLAEPVPTPPVAEPVPEPPAAERIPAPTRPEKKAQRTKPAVNRRATAKAPANAAAHTRTEPAPHPPRTVVKQPAASGVPAGESARSADTRPAGGPGTGSGRPGTGSPGGPAGTGSGTGGNPGAAGPVAFGAADGPSFDRRVRPKYPRLAVARKEEGTVTLVLHLDGKGHLLDAEVVESAGPRLDKAALEAARKSTYRPAEQNGSCISCRAILRMRFTLRS